MSGLSEAVVICHGDLNDPAFSLYLAGVKERLQKILQADKEEFHVINLEPWNSVRVTFHLPDAAAIRLRGLAERNPALLHALGIYSVQTSGEDTVCVLLDDPQHGTGAVFSAAGPSHASQCRPSSSNQLHTNIINADLHGPMSGDSRVESGLGSSRGSSETSTSNGHVLADHATSESVKRTVMNLVEKQDPNWYGGKPHNPVSSMQHMVKHANHNTDSPLLVNLLRSQSPSAAMQATVNPNQPPSGLGPPSVAMTAANNSNNTNTMTGMRPPSPLQQASVMYQNHSNAAISSAANMYMHQPSVSTPQTSTAPNNPVPVSDYSTASGVSVSTAPNPSPAKPRQRRTANAAGGGGRGGRRKQQTQVGSMLSSRFDDLPPPACLPPAMMQQQQSSGPDRPVPVPNEPPGVSVAQAYHPQQHVQPQPQTHMNYPPQYDNRPPPPSHQQSQQQQQQMYAQQHYSQPGKAAQQSGPPAAYHAHQQMQRQQQFANAEEMRMRNESNASANVANNARFYDQSSNPSTNGDSLDTADFSQLDENQPSTSQAPGLSAQHGQQIDECIELVLMQMQPSTHPHMGMAPAYRRTGPPVHRPAHPLISDAPYSQGTPLRHEHVNGWPQGFDHNTQAQTHMVRHSAPVASYPPPQQQQQTRVMFPAQTPQSMYPNTTGCGTGPINGMHDHQQQWKPTQLVNGDAQSELSMRAGQPNSTDVNGVYTNNHTPQSPSPWTQSAHMQPPDHLKRKLSSQSLAQVTHAHEPDNALHDIDFDAVHALGMDDVALHNYTNNNMHTVTASATHGSPLKRPHVDHAMLGSGDVALKQPAVSNQQSS